MLSETKAPANPTQSPAAMPQAQVGSGPESTPSVALQAASPSSPVAKFYNGEPAQKAAPPPDVEASGSAGQPRDVGVTLVAGTLAAGGFIAVCAGSPLGFLAMFMAVALAGIAGR